MRAPAALESASSAQSSARCCTGAALASASLALCSVSAACDASCSSRTRNPSDALAHGQMVNARRVKGGHWTRYSSECLMRWTVGGWATWRA